MNKLARIFCWAALFYGSDNCVRNYSQVRDLTAKMDQMISHQRKIDWLEWNSQKDGYEPVSEIFSGKGDLNVQWEEYLPASWNQIVNRAENWIIKPGDTSLPKTTPYHRNPKVTFEEETLIGKRSHEIWGMAISGVGALVGSLLLLLQLPVVRRIFKQPEIIYVHSPRIEA